MSNTKLAGSLLSFAGSVLWIYGYVTTGAPPLIDWQATAPWWIADFLPNIEAEIGMALMYAALLPMYWPTGRSREA